MNALKDRYVKKDVALYHHVKIIRSVHSVKYVRIGYASLRNAVKNKIVHLDLNAMKNYAPLSLAQILPHAHKILYVIMDNVLKHPAKRECRRSALMVRLA